MNDPGRLLPDGLHDARVGMPEGVHPQSGHEVEVLLALEVIEKNTFAALKAHRITVVGGEKKALFKIGNLIEAGHGFIVERTEGGSGLSAISFQFLSRDHRILSRKLTPWSLTRHPDPSLCGQVACARHPKKQTLPSIIHS